jgi:Ca-activated chloride channel family protein
MAHTNFSQKAMQLVLCFLLTLSSSLAFGQAKRDASDEGVVKLKATLVQVPVVVSDAGGRYITDLKQKDFLLYEDGVLQKIEFFASVEEPISVALLLDSSGSTSDQLAEIKKAALAFIDNLRPQDRVMVINFDDSVHVQCELTGDRDLLAHAINSIRPGEYTQLYEAVYTAVWEKLQAIEGRKAVIVFTDGIDTASSEITEDDTLDAIIESEDIIVYPIRYSTRQDVERRLGLTTVSDTQQTDERRRKLDRTYRHADTYLHELAEYSGGVVQRADTLRDLKAAFAKIADELRHQYLLGYYPSNDKADDRERKVSVRVLREGARVRARPSYRLNQNQ